MDTMVKIYELRVDSISTDILRIADRVPSEFVCVKLLYIPAALFIHIWGYEYSSKRIQLLCAGSPRDSINELNDSVPSNEDVHHDVPMQRNKKDRRRKRRLNNNVRVNIATKVQLNAPLQMLSSIPNSIITKKQKIDGEEGKSNRMLLNLFSTAGKSNVSLCGSHLFFDTSRTERIKFENNNDYDVPDDTFFELPIKVHHGFLLIRPTESGYVLKETLDDDENEYW